VEEGDTLLLVNTSPALCDIKLLIAQSLHSSVIGGGTPNGKMMPPGTAFTAGAGPGHKVLSASQRAMLTGPISCGGGVRDNVW